MQRIRTDNTRRYSLIAVFAAIAVSVVYLRMSELAGRLSQDLAYDDVSYAVEAAARLEKGFTSGIGAFLLSLVQDPPHSSFSTLLATVGLLVGGYHEIAIYATNSVLLVLVAWFLARQFGAAGVGTVTWIVAAFLFSPLAYTAIHDFRPDIALGFATAAMVWWFSLGLARGEHRAFTWAGFAFGASLLVKPTFFAHTLALALGLTGIHLMLLVSRGVGKQIPQPRPRDLGRFLVIGLLLALPYYAIGGTAIFDYFWTNTQEETAKIWSFSPDLSVTAVAQIFLRMQRTIGYHLFLAAGLVVIGLGWTIYQKKHPDILVLACLVSFALMSYAILVFGRVRNEFFFATFQSLVLLAGLFSFSYLASAWGGYRRRTLLVAAWIALGASILANQDIAHLRVYDDSNRFRSWNTRVVNLLGREMASLGATRIGSFTPKVLVPGAGPVNADVLEWVAMKQGLRISTIDFSRRAETKDHVSMARKSHFTVVANPLTAEISWGMPSGKVHGPLLAALLKDPQFRLVDQPSNDTRYFVFANTGLLERQRLVMDVDGLVDLAGIERMDKPFLGWELSHTRWMTERDAQVCLVASTPGKYAGKLRFRALTAGFMTVIGPDGKKLVGGPLSEEAFSELQFSVSLPEGASCLVLRAETTDAPDAAAPLVFTRIAIKRQP